MENEAIKKKVQDVIAELRKQVCAEVSADDETRTWKQAYGFMEYKVRTCADRLEKIFE